MSTMVAERLVLAMSRRAGSRRRGFTLVELLVVMAVITILAALIMPAITKSLAFSKIASCLNHLRQIGGAYTSYTSDWDSWLVCGGNRAREHPGSINGEYPLDVLLELPWQEGWEMDFNFAYWYEVLQPYVNSGANRANVLIEFEKRFGEPYDPDVHKRWDYQLILAELCGIYACPNKRMAQIGYGYNYLAAYGDTSVYYYDAQWHRFKWRYDNNSSHYATYPCKFRGPASASIWGDPTAGSKPVPWIIPLLWYNQHIHLGVITDPSQQIIVCDTGKVFNDQEASWNPTDPREWLEAQRGTYLGYVRFPITDYYIGRKEYRRTGAWRPVPRHGGRTCSVFFDGSARAAHIYDIVGYQWGKPKCMFDNKPPHKPPVSPMASPVETADS
jgi:prepilin-type N-terminal cleavage/methylation domain-containing protein